MKKMIVEKYTISKDRVMHMKLQTINIPEDEVFDMIKRYKFDSESTQRMLSEAQRLSEEYKFAKEQKEYEEMNYEAICRRMSELSTPELIKRLLRRLKKA